ncbi:hypothetical protein ColTof4_06011 [Colletotrichum tofieldiae]|uniref:Secreted protein n=1 Tax=Colletotrichum tofieldiae TaxID=708197 RepID=A0A166VA00_9PEZI|nr:hypothetical protein CT0861_01013 [Colletotrichum tofieldiae]GKT53848.1 hypothetical protein ColTof3_01187 [Colletotrichum tofieldiae]GKT73588.1 hypothetical protein ColTof4_06011 [Colletotrichum tofieldiae]GKT95535.1 hypothetical protein Ct61P_13385 [Colletotrichum tofieldiae]
MRSSTFALVIFTLVYVTLGAVVAVTVFQDGSFERHAAFPSAIATTIIKMANTAATTTSVPEMSPLWTVNTVMCETVVINAGTHRPITTAAVSRPPTVKCDREGCQDSTFMCAPWAGVVGRDPVKVPIPGDSTTSLGKCTTPTVSGEHGGLKTLNNEFITPAPIDSAPTPAPASIDCKYKYCNSNTQYCMYWAGVTGWDPSLGPIPGMTHTSLGVCQVPVTDYTTNNVVQTTMATKKKCTRSTANTIF